MSDTPRSRSGGAVSDDAPRVATSATHRLRTLSVGSSGDLVRLLHARLLDLDGEIDHDELVAGMFGHSTRHALLRVQGRLGLAMSGAADAQVREDLDGADAPHRRYVVVQVLGPDERPVAGASVEALDRDLRTSESLGKGKTGDDGVAVLAYDLASAERGEEATADVDVRVRLGRKVVHQPDLDDTVFDAPALVVVVVRLAVREVPSATQWQRVTEAVEPLLADVPWVELAEDAEHRDITFLARETGLDAHPITAAALARRLGSLTDVEPQLFFAVLVLDTLASARRWASLMPRWDLAVGTDPETLLDDLALVPRADLEATVARAVDTFVIDRDAARDLPRLLEVLGARSDEAAARAAERRRAVLTEHVTHLVESDVAGTIEALLADDPLGDLPGVVGRLLQMDLVPQGKARDESLSRLSLVELLGDDPELIERVRTEHHISAVADVHRLATLTPRDWAAALPRSASSGAGAVLADRMAARFPTTAFAARLSDDDDPPLPHAAAVADALARHPEFDLARGRSATLLAEDDVDLSPEAAGSLAAAQRLFRVAPTYPRTRALMQNGLWSSQAVLAQGRQRFVREAVDSGAFDSAQALAAYDKASGVHTAALILAGQLQEAATATLLPALAAAPADLSPVVAEFPNMKSLFSTIDMCECPDCRSVHGAPAYLVDVLQFLGNRLVVDTTTTPPTTLKAARDVLLARRPDLTVTDLSCANTNTSLPYLDLVCELLEEAVSPDPGVPYAGPVADGVVAPVLLAALQGAGLAFTADAVVHGPDLDGGFVVRDERVVVGITPDGPAWRLRVLRQTFGTEAELAAAPQYVHAPAYAALAADTACFTLPLDLAHRETRAYFTQLGADRADLMAALRTAGAPTAAQLAAERLGLSDGQRHLVVTPDPGGQQAIWTTPGTPAAASLTNVDALVTRSGRTYADLLELVDLPWVDGGQDLFVQHLDASADLAAKVVVNLDDAALDRVHRFLRLRDVIGWSSATLDRALRSPMGGAGTLDDACLVQLDLLRSLASALRTTVDGVLDVLEPLDVDAPTGPYARWFLDPIRVGSVEPAFEPAAVHTNEAAETATPGSGTRLSAVAGALGLALGGSTAETAHLVTALGDPAITAASLGAALGWVRLARGLRMPVADLLAVHDLDPADPFASPAACRTLVDRVAAVRASGVPPTTLRYLLRHEATDLAAFEMPAAPVLAFLTDLHAAYAAALAADASPYSPEATPEENTAAVRPFLARLGLADGDLSLLQTLLTDTWTDTTTTEAAFVTAVLGPLVDVTAVQAALVARDLAPEPKDAARNDVLDAVGAAVAAALYDADRRTALVTGVATTFAIEETDAATLVDHARLKEPAAAGDPLLAEVLLDDSTAPATLTLQEGAVRLVHTLVLLSSRAGIATATLAWLLDHAVALGWAEPDRLPYAAGQPVTSFDDWERTRAFLDLAAAYPDVADPADPEVPFSVPRYVEALLAGDAPTDTLAQLGALAGVDPAVLVALDSHLGLTAVDRQDLTTAASLLSTATLLRTLGLDVPTAVQVSTPTPTLDDALRMRAAVRSRYADAEWLGVLKQIQDPLREAKRDALVAYLLAHNPDLASSDDLYDWFLIDNQMTACMTTSRIVQAHATVQLFAMRCLMGLEPTSVASVGTDDGWTQWDWMANFRVWEANRKIFLWPENWISPDLRDDRSEPFVAATEALAQDALTDTAVEGATSGYLQTLEDLAHLDVRAAYYDTDKRVEHVFARSRGGNPFVYYHRELQRERAWTPWTTVPLDIGPDQLLAFSRNSRLTLAWPQFMQEPDVDAPPPDTPDPAALSGGQANENPKKRWKIQLAVSELSDGRWREKRVSLGALYTPFSLTPPATSSFNFFVWGFGGNQAVSCFGPSGFLGSFALTGCKGVPEAQQGGGLPGWLLPWFVNTDLKAGVFVEQPEDVGGELAIIDQPSADADVILARTPAGVFGVTYPLQMTILDWIVLLLQVWAGQSGGMQRSSYDRRLALPLGTLLPWFFGDLARDYVVVPGFYPSRGRDDELDLTAEVDPTAELGARKKTASNVLDLVEDVLLLVQKYLAKHAADPGVPLADLVAELTADPDYLAIVDEVSSYQGLRYGLQIRNFWHPLVCAFRKALNAGGIPALMDRDLQLTDTGFDFAATYQPSALVVPPYPREDVDFDLAGAYASYNWELFYHLPMAMAARHNQDQQFAKARSWMHYVFNPVGAGDDPAPRRFWNTKPFYLAGAADYLEQRIDTILGTIAADPSAATIGDLEFAVTQWREKPFTPDVVARSRPVAYQMATVIAYVQNLVDWGDSLFRQFTRESVNQATQLYVLAGKLLGPKPRIVPPAVPVPDMTYDQLRGQIDIFGNALLDLETLVPDVTALPHGGAELPPAPASLTSLYFCIPPNEVLLAKWDLVADRLFKIRHCQNIDGVEASLALFSPPIDPGALARAAAAGVDVASFLASLGAPPPHYRFSTVAAKSLELAQHVAGLGSALLSALEKRDGEALALLRQKQELAVLDALRQVKVAAIAEAQGSLDALRASADLIQERIDFYSSREFMNAGEITATVLNGVSLLGEAAVALGYALAGGLSAIPNFLAGGSGFGGTPTVDVETGGSSFGKAAEQATAMLSSLTRVADKGASLAATQGGYQRRQDDWDFQKALAEGEMDQLDLQIANAELRLATLAQDLVVHDLQAKNARSLDEFMRSRFTNQKLYGWMAGQISSTYYAAYKLAFDTAKRAERAFGFELATDTTFLKFGYWDSMRKGLLAAEGLVHDIHRMQVAYLDQNAREYELTKHVSLAAIDPGALWQLRTTGKVTVQVPEAAFDLDHPNHYLRRLKTVSASVVCNAAPYATVGMTLSLVANKYRKATQPRVGATTDRDRYAEELGADPRFAYNVGGISSVATSSAVSDSGLFELSFHDERYLPFEGAGAVSTWRIELPTAFPQFDHDTLSDVVLHLRYTAREGGSGFRSMTEKALGAVLNESLLVAGRTGLYVAYSLRDSFPDAWWQLQDTGSTNITIDEEHLPWAVRSHSPTLTGVTWAAQVDGSPATFPITVDGAGTTLNRDTTMTRLCVGTVVGATLGTPMTVACDASDLTDLSVLVAYTIT